ncbi:LPXTG cell wall anchor domain-containing protein [Listeria sp. FSL L7-1699]|uniref:LPXTG cell wall anchor domain-containing protein n=1 Tax=Listeria farberi TaxID=2713500 RepID=A0ABR6SKU3_9LIST|nr:bacterial Ig-like domain-containing protein [Listeria farberi]MBC1374833.1 LPXTG cell wall anchor domain-containing protein [Listeria farberi]MBC1380579.1 LPXTG cell wall anchor domain-containing protein [Listeria farberi]
MMKLSKARHYLVLLMAFFLVLGQLNLTALNVFAKENGNDELTYEVQSKLAEDKKTADLTIKVTPTNDQVKILTIETPDGEKKEGQEVSYKAEKNGTTNFLINYQNTSEEKAETKTYTASYEVSDIVSEDEVNKDTETEKAPEKEDANIQPPSTTNNTKSLKSGQTTVELKIPDYNQTAWANGDIKEVTATVNFGDSTSTGKKVNFTLPDGMRFVSLPVPNNYQAGTNVDKGLLSYLGASDPLGVAITSAKVPDKETTYNQATFGTVSYELSPGTEKASFTFSVRVDAAKYYGPTDLVDPIKTEVFKGEASTPVASAEQAIHAEGNKVVGYANQDHVKTMFRHWYNDQRLSEVLASTDAADSYNYTKSYSVVNGSNSLDSRGSMTYIAKNIEITLYYPEGMEFVDVINNNGGAIKGDSNLTITNYPSENKVVINNKRLNSSAASNAVYGVKYKVPKGTPAGTYSTDKVPHAVITTYDGEVFESDALTSNSSDLTTLAPLDICKVVDTTENKMTLTAANGQLNPNNETWAGSIQINNKNSAGVKKNQMYQIKFDPNWEAYMVNIPFDSTISGNKISEVQYKTNLNGTFRTFDGALIKNNNQMYRLDAKAVGLEDGEYFTEVKANVGDFAPGYLNTESSATYRWNSTASYGKIKPGVTSVQYEGAIWDADDEANTKVSGTSTYKVSTAESTAANGTAAFYNKAGTMVKTASAGETINTKATLLLHDYPYGTRTVLNDPEVYLHALEGTTIQPSSIKLTDQDGKDVNFTVEQETANNGDKVYVLKTTDVSVGAFVGYPTKTKYLNISYNTTFDVTLDKSINMDAQQVIAWGANVTPATANNTFSDLGLDVNKNGRDNDRLLSVNSSTLSIPKQDTVTVETFLSVAGEGAKAAYVEGEDSTVSYFTPGTDADYTVKITNTSSGNASTFELYIPIPKTGQDFGSKFQSEPFKWDMKLNGALPVNAEQQDQFDVSYATTATGDNYDSNDIYSDTVADYEKVNMVRIKVKTQINAGETQTFKVPLKVDETFDTATEGYKIGERDIYNPYYRVITNTFSGSLSGTKVGAELVIGEVAGTLFNDKDANGLYEKDKGDEPLASETVELYKWNEATSAYEPAKVGDKNVTATTDSNGKYSFDYNDGVGYGNYAVKFPDKAGYQYTLKNIGKDISLDSDVPYSGADKGWVKQVDPTQPSSQYTNAGYYAYDPTQDLKVNLDEKQVQMGRSLEITLPKVASTTGLAAEDTIEPSIFKNIKAATDGYKWTVADTNVATVQTLADGSAAVVGVSTNNKTIDVTDLTITIQDIFGTEKSSKAPVYVTGTEGTVAQQDGYTMGATDFSIEYKEATALTKAQALTLAKTAAFEEVKDGVNSSAEDRLDQVQVNQAQLDAIKNGSNQGGVYPLTYTITKDSKTVSVTIQVTVAKDLTAVNAHDSTIYVGDTWDAEDNFDSATNKEGDTNVAFSDVTVTGTVNTAVAGSYPVTYTYNGVSKKINVTVKAKLTAVNAHDSTIYTGDTWNAGDNFDSALDKDGNSVAFADITVAGTVNTNQAGTNTITYSYDGVSKTITVTVLENKEGISAHDSTIYVGDAWNAKDNFDSAFDKDGNAVDLEDVTVTEKPTVDTTKAGAYEVTYKYGKVSKKITLTVKAKLTAVNAHDSTIYVGDAWSAEDNFDSALDKDGNSVAFADIEVKGTVDTDKAGTYPVTYTYDGVSKTINIQVKDILTAVNAHDSEIYVGDSWDAKDNFDSAQDKDGNTVDWQDISVSENPTVDLETAGVYQVTYSYDGVSKTINLTVNPRKTSVEVHDSTIYTGDTWKAEDNFDNATDKKGDQISFEDVTVTGQVDPETAGAYEVSYSYDGVEKVAHITVIQNQAQITVKDSVIPYGEKWEAEANFIGATNRDGVAIPFSKIQVDGTVDVNKAGTYKVIYTYDPNEGTADAGKKQLSVTANIQVEAEIVNPVKPVDPSDPTEPTNPVKPSTPTKPSTEKTPLKVVDNKQHTATYEEAKPLPKTGDQTNTWVIWTGLSLLVLSMLLLAMRGRKKKYQ